MFRTKSTNQQTPPTRKERHATAASAWAPPATSSPTENGLDRSKKNISWIPDSAARWRWYVFQCFNMLLCSIVEPPGTTFCCCLLLPPKRKTYKKFNKKKDTRIPGLHTDKQQSCLIGSITLVRCCVCRRFCSCCAISCSVAAAVMPCCCRCYSVSQTQKANCVTNRQQRLHGQATRSIPIQLIWPEWWFCLAQAVQRWQFNPHLDGIKINVLELLTVWNAMATFLSTVFLLF